MNEDEYIPNVFLRMDKIANIMRVLDETIKGSTIVQRVLRSIPVIFNAKVLAIENMSNHDQLTMDQLLGTLDANEMRTTKGKSASREVAFKAYNKNKDVTYPLLI